MKRYSKEQLKKRLIVCIIFGVILAVAMGIGASVAGGLPLIAAVGMILFAGIVFSVEFFGMSFNFGKVILGMIAPIPILSMFIETFKSIIYAIKGIMVIVKNQDYLVIGKSEDTDA